MDGDDQAANVFPDERHLYGAASIAEKLTPSEKLKARKAIAVFLLASEENRTLIHYTQHRPFDPSVTPAKGYRGDCSSYPTQAFWYAQDVIDAPLSDPNGRAYDGYGFTGTLLQVNHAHGAPPDKYMVGDLAIYGGSFWSTRHVVICRVKGTVETAVWSSHGSEAGPLPERLTYRSDLLGVYRPASLL